MRKLILAILISLVCLNLVHQTALADGAVFPGDFNTGYLVVRYHHVTVTIHDNQAVTRVEQEFYNPYDYPVTGQYLFPVAPDAVLTRFQATLDKQTQSVTRQDAATTNAALYAIVSQRRDPSLLQYADWESFTFTLSLPARSARRMVLDYEQVLTPTGGLFRYHYVLSTERYSSSPLEQVSVTVDVNSSSGLASIYSPSHPVDIEYVGPTRAKASWSAENVQPVDDFDLFFAPAEIGFGGGLLTGPRAGQDHFMFLFSPQTHTTSESYLPKDIVFVIDRSGSMGGEKIEQARNALRYFIDQLGSEDRFSVIAFNHDRMTYSEVLRSPDDATLAEARRFVGELDADGSTDIEAALQAGLAIMSRSELRAEAARLIVFLTDGLPTAGILDEGLIVSNITQVNRGLSARLHVFGVGYDVNTYLLDRLSSSNNGSVTYVQPGENLESILTAFYDRVAHPLLTDVTVEFQGMQVSDVYPQVTPDLFEGSSLMLTGRYQAAGSNVTVRVRGKAGNSQQEYIYNFDLAQTGNYDFVPRLWATRRVGELLDQVRVKGENSDLVGEITDLGLSYGVVTPYTSFVINAQANGAASASNMALYEDKTALNQSSGQVTIQARVQNQAYQQATQANLANGANTLNMGQHSVAQLDDLAAEVLNVDLSIFRGQKNLGSEPITVEWIQNNIGIDQNVNFASVEYFQLAANPEIRPFLQSGINVIFAYDGQVFQVQEGTAADSGVNNPIVSANQSTTKLSWLNLLWAAFRHLLELLGR